MKTLFVSGSDTNVGKTWVVGVIAHYLLDKGNSVQVVKPIETGVFASGDSDVEKVMARCSGPMLTGYTLQSFREPIAPVAAAENEGETLDFSATIASVAGLPGESDWRIVEGAGSLATPVSSSGEDWADLAVALNVRSTILVVENRVGAIGQARMVYEFGSIRGLRCGIWLNEITPQNSRERKGTLEGIQKTGIPIWGSSHSGQLKVELREAYWL